MNIGLAIALIAAALALGAVIGFLVRRMLIEKKLGIAKNQAELILQDADKKAEALKKERLLEAK
ncbi:MAG: DUF3552 domain-containing protein, partial [Clostridia bacterium]|nr:DUF3552 domain-containing protein [Clostridia bacterium]